MYSIYKESNSDLPRDLMNQMAVFVLAKRLSKQVLEDFFGRPLGIAPRWHRSWLWYQAMRTSGLGHLWPELAERFNGGESMKSCLVWLRSVVSKQSWGLMSVRMGSTISGRNYIKPSEYSRFNNKNLYITKGGVWSTRSQITKIIVLKQHIDRDYTWNRRTVKLGPDKARRLESELANVIDYERMLYPDAICAAVSYVRERGAEMIGERTHFGTAMVSWFFQYPVPIPETPWWVVSWERPTASKRTDAFLWFPPENI